MDLTLPKTVANEDLMRVACEFVWAGGTFAELRTVLGVSEERWKEFDEWRELRAQPRVPDRRYPILIPETSPARYVSYKRALNLRVEGEWTGDWHHDISFFGYPEPSYVHLAGKNCDVNTNRTLGSLGVRDMGKEIAHYGIKAYAGPVWVANHYRAIADIATLLLQGRCSNEVLPACQISDWMWDENDFEILVRDYLTPLRNQFHGLRREAFDQWLPTVVYGATYD